jgi:hypothetical protein
MDNEQARRVAENEATFRQANEEIVASARELEFPPPVPFICECGEPGCREIVQLTYREYEAVRAEPTHFFVVGGHERVAGPAGDVVDRNDRYVVVKKLGAGAEVAEAEDPRTSAQ